jgi:hypothetical protein
MAFVTDAYFSSGMAAVFFGHIIKQQIEVDHLRYHGQYALGQQLHSGGLSLVQPDQSLGMVEYALLAQRHEIAHHPMRTCESPGRPAAWGCGPSFLRFGAGFPAE